MTRLLAANGAAVEWATNASVDTFTRADGDLAGWRQRRNGGVQWYDAAETWPLSFDVTQIATNQADFTPSTTDTYWDGDPTYEGDFIVGHGLLAVDIGISDNFEIEVAWEQDRPWGRLSQVGPCFGIDLEAADPEQMGVLYTWDISLGDGLTYGYSYWHNAFRCTLSETLDPQYYNFLGGSNVFPYPNAGRHWWRIRCVDGYMAAWFDGTAMGGVVARPAWTVGRTKVGIHVVGINVTVGQPMGASGDISDLPYPTTRISRFQWQPYSTPLQ